MEFHNRSCWIPDNEILTVLCCSLSPWPWSHHVRTWWRCTKFGNGSINQIDVFEKSDCWKRNERFMKHVLIERFGIGDKATLFFLCCVSKLEISIRMVYYQFFNCSLGDNQKKILTMWCQPLVEVEPAGEVCQEVKLRVLNPVTCKS